MSDAHVDLINIVGLEHSTFYDSGEDITLVEDKNNDTYARLFKKGKRVVYRAGVLSSSKEQDRRDH